MPETALARLLARWRAAYAASPVRRFLVWWGHELAPLVPRRVSQWFADQREQIWVRLEPDAVALRAPAGEERRLELGGDGAEAARAEIARELSAHEERPDVVLCLAEARVLCRQLQLPAAAEQNLRQVLGFEMDRQTPFRADQVYYDQRIVRRDADGKQIVVELALVPRAAVEAELARAESLGLPLDALDAEHAGARLGYNLLPPERRAPRRQLWLRLDLALGAAVLVLLGVTMVQSLANRERALEALREHTQRVQTEARAVAVLRKTLKEAVDGANFLAERKRARPVVIDLLLDVTLLLGNDTWLQRFSLNGDQVQLQGQSREAASLIAVLQKSPMLEGPALQGAITPDARTGKEQFLIAAKAKLPEAAAPAAEEEPRATAAQR
jgi:general secretion pathway protein L